MDIDSPAGEPILVRFRGRAIGGGGGEKENVWAVWAARGARGKGGPRKPMAVELCPSNCNRTMAQGQSFFPPGYWTQVTFEARVSLG